MSAHAKQRSSVGISVWIFTLSCKALVACGDGADFAINSAPSDSVTSDGVGSNSHSSDGKSVRPRDQDVAGKNKPTIPIPRDPKKTKVLPAAHALFMPWLCPGAGSGPTSPIREATVATMPGSYTLPVKEPVQVVQAGYFCNSSMAARDLIFVIDVSDSMRGPLNFGNDRLRKGTCGRVTAVDTVLSTLDDQARVALITFDDGVRRDSGGFMSVAALRLGFVKPDILCESGSGTKYQPALARAEQLLTTRRPAAQAEVYFLSDGKPNDAISDGSAEAARIRTNATIVTMMLKGDDDVLIDKIASRDASGLPLHGKVDTAEDMAAKLKALAASTLSSVTLRVVSGDPAAKVLSEQHFEVASSSADNFLAAPIVIKPQEYPAGVVFKMLSLDSRGVTSTQSGSLRFNP